MQTTEKNTYTSLEGLIWWTLLILFIPKHQRIFSTLFQIKLLIIILGPYAYISKHVIRVFNVFKSPHLSNYQHMRSSKTLLDITLIVKNCSSVCKIDMARTNKTKEI